MIIDPASQRRFWSKVTKTDSCWNWAAAVRKGYGAFKFEGKVYDAHRFAYLIVYGDIDEGLVICHKCDNTLCVNTDHMFLGTVGDNNRDMLAKGRNWKGPNWDPNREDKLQKHSTKGTTAKLTQSEADTIRQLVKMGYPIRDLCRRFSVARRTIQDIVSGRTW